MTRPGKALRGGDRRALGRRSRHGRLLRRASKAPLARHLGEPLQPPPVAPARSPPTDWGELVQVHDDRDVLQSSSDELPAIDIHSP